MLAIQNQTALTQKTSKAKPRPPTMSKSVEVKAGRTAVQKMPIQNLRKVVIYENKPSSAERGRSRNTATEGCKKF